MDSTVVEVPGSWTHRYISANGNRFHVVEANPGTAGRVHTPLVVLLHGFPHFWWTWRHQLPALAAGGFRAVAMDLRGVGSSDKPPRGYDTPTLAADVAGVVRSLGEQETVVVGQGWGSWIAWAMPHLTPRGLRGIAVTGSAHPAMGLSTGALLELQRLAMFQLPLLPERQLRRGDLVERVLTEWSGSDYPDDEERRRYAEAMLIPSAAFSTLETFRWAGRSRLRPDGARFRKVMHQQVGVPVLQVHGALDPTISPAVARRAGEFVRSSYRFSMLDDVGHFVPEEAPDRFNELLLDWLSDL